MIWASRWSGSPCAHSIGKFFLCYIVLFLLETSAPGLSGHYWYIHDYINQLAKVSPVKMCWIPPDSGVEKNRYKYSPFKGVQNCGNSKNQVAFLILGEFLGMNSWISCRHLSESWFPGKIQLFNVAEVVWSIIVVEFLHPVNVAKLGEINKSPKRPNCFRKNFQEKMNIVKRQFQ